MYWILGGLAVVLCVVCGARHYFRLQAKARREEKAEAVCEELWEKLPERIGKARMAAQDAGISPETRALVAELALDFYELQHRERAGFEGEAEAEQRELERLSRKLDRICSIMRSERKKYARLKLRTRKIDD